MRALAVVVALASCAAQPPPRRVEPTTLMRIEASRDIDGALVGASPDPTIVILFASWCEHCRDELVVLDAIRHAHRVRMLGINYRAHEEYDHKGNPEAVRAVARTLPWLRVVPIGEDVFGALGRPPTIPFMIVYDRGGAAVATFDRRDRTPPGKGELDALLARLGA
jgi:thiol-disulfide isomerase/thioredoxin